MQHYGFLSAGSGSRRARSSSIPARPYICRFSILSRLSCVPPPARCSTVRSPPIPLRLGSCFKVRTKRTNQNGYLSCRPSSIQRWRVATLPPRRITRKLRTSLRMTAKRGHCRFRVSTICACWLVNSARTLLNSATATCGDSCLDPVEAAGSSCITSGNAEIALRVSAFGWATAKGILPVPSSNRRSRVSESPPIACAHADSHLPNAFSLGVNRHRTASDTDPRRRNYDSCSTPKRRSVTTTTCLTSEKRFPAHVLPYERLWALGVQTSHSTKVPLPLLDS